MDKLIISSGDKPLLAIFLLDGINDLDDNGS
jgi:hypothetical protein